MAAGLNGTHIFLLFLPVHITFAMYVYQLRVNVFVRTVCEFDCSHMHSSLIYHSFPLIFAFVLPMQWNFIKTKYFSLVCFDDSACNFNHIIDMNPSTYKRLRGNFVDLWREFAESQLINRYRMKIDFAISLGWSTMNMWNILFVKSLLAFAKSIYVSKKTFDWGWCSRRYAIFRIKIVMIFISAFDDSCKQIKKNLFLANIKCSIYNNLLRNSLASDACITLLSHHRINSISLWNRSTHVMFHCHWFSGNNHRVQKSIWFVSRRPKKIVGTAHFFPHSNVTASQIL